MRTSSPFLISGMLLVATLAACQLSPAPGALAPAGQGGTRVQGRVVPLGAAPKLGFHLLQTKTNRLTDVAHVALHLTRVSGSDGAASEAFLGNLPGWETPIDLQQLRHSSTYALRLEAFTEDGLRIDDQATGCTTTFNTETAPLMTDLEFNLKLADTEFDGRSEVSLQVNTEGANVQDAEDVTASAATITSLPAALYGRSFTSTDYTNPVFVRVQNDLFLVDLSETPTANPDAPDVTLSGSVFYGQLFECNGLGSITIEDFNKSTYAMFTEPAYTELGFQLQLPVFDLDAYDSGPGLYCEVL